MCRRHPDPRASRPPRSAPIEPSGMTLVELLVAMSILVLVAGTLAALGRGVQQSYEYCEGYGQATQHGRVALERIERTVDEATANEQFPGFLVLADTVGSWRLPEVLVVWHPPGAPADLAGLPRYSELVIFCPDWYSQNQLVEITVPGDTRVVPAVTDLAAWRTEVTAIRKNALSRSVTLTDLVRTCPIPESTALPIRGAVRFESRLRPSQSEWNEYQAGTRAWNAIAWPQGIFGTKTGLRQAWLRIELQLMPGADWVANEEETLQPMPFFGSAAVYYELPR
jgi:prepilin-type N-terminal cleavage/methylation domain-containing protein